MTRRGLFALPLALFAPRPKAEERTVETYDLCPGWSITTDDPAWLANEELDEKAALKWRPKAEYTSTTKVFRTVNHA